ncbi:hypothetical protein [Longimicrobium sp.]|uniref:hypothetical protein n=1 Tax=Longimicrobium sp. TaxID=2029185 RepID=UPI002E37148A|nr:hypothetical protein [Longimicrobium sp.]HEX6038626.1 hypothetical protein [Longimicrobium sp.]
MGLLLHPQMAHAQPGSGTRHEYTFPGAEIPPRGPSWGFSTIMRPGPGNDPYVYPIVGTVWSGSAAAAAGMMAGDTIIAIDGQDMRYHPFFPVRVAGTRYLMLVRRGAEELELVYVYPKEENPPGEQPAAAPPR